MHLYIFSRNPMAVYFWCIRSCKHSIISSQRHRLIQEQGCRSDKCCNTDTVSFLKTCCGGEKTDSTWRGRCLLVIFQSAGRRFAFHFPFHSSGFLYCGAESIKSNIRWYVCYSSQLEKSFASKRKNNVRYKKEQEKDWFITFFLSWNSGEISLLEIMIGFKNIILLRWIHRGHKGRSNKYFIILTFFFYI